MQYIRQGRRTHEGLARRDWTPLKNVLVRRDLMAESITADFQVQKGRRKMQGNEGPFSSRHFRCKTNLSERIPLRRVRDWMRASLLCFGS